VMQIPTYSPEVTNPSSMRTQGAGAHLRRPCTTSRHTQGRGRRVSGLINGMPTKCYSQGRALHDGYLPGRYREARRVSCQALPLSAVDGTSTGLFAEGDQS